MAQRLRVDPDEIRKILDLVVSKEIVKILQVLVFSFREAIGRPVTNLVVRLINSQGPIEPEDPDAMRRLALANQITPAQPSMFPHPFG